MIPRNQLSVWVLEVHVRQIIFHGLCWKHIHVFEAEGLADILLDVVVKTRACLALKYNSSPINACL
jgi:hypothetical protein